MAGDDASSRGRSPSPTLETAPTQAVSVASLATAPTEAVGVVPLPGPAASPSHSPAAFAPTVLAPAVPAATPAQGVASPAPPSATVAPPIAPAPGMAPRRGLALVIGGIVLAAALASVLLLARHHGLLWHGGGKAHSALAGPPVTGAFSSLTKDQIRARIEDAGHRVQSETTTEGVTTWLVETRVAGISGSVKLLRFNDASQAAQTFASLRASGAAVAHDGKAVLHVTMPASIAAQALLDKITR